MKMTINGPLIKIIKYPWDGSLRTAPATTTPGLGIKFFLPKRFEYFVKSFFSPGKNNLTFIFSSFHPFPSLLHSLSFSLSLMPLQFLSLLCYFLFVSVFLFFLFLFNVMASGGLYSLIYINNLQS